MAILSVDLAYRRWSDLGIVVLDRADPGAHLAQPSEAAAGGSSTVPQTAAFSGHTARSRRSGWPITCEIIPSMTPGDERGPVDANVLAGRLNHLCTVRDMRVIMLDGPQAWKSSLNGLQHSRVSERQLNTAAKTGLPGMVKPVTYRAFAEFCLDVYDALCRRGWRRLETKEQPGAAAERVLVESYPHAAWKSLGLKPLPAKRHARVSDLAEAYGALRTLIPFTTSQPPNHDQLQAIVGGLPGWHLKSAMRPERALWAIRRAAKTDTGGKALLCCRWRRTGRQGWDGSTACAGWIKGCPVCGIKVWRERRQTLSQ